MSLASLFQTGFIYNGEPSLDFIIEFTGPGFNSMSVLLNLSAIVQLCFYLYLLETECHRAVQADLELTV